MLYVRSWTPDDGRKDRPKHVEWYSVNSKNCASGWFNYRNIFWSVLCMWCRVSGQKPVSGRPSEWPAGSRFTILYAVPGPKVILQPNWTLYCMFLTQHPPPPPLPLLTKIQSQCSDHSGSFCVLELSTWNDVTFCTSKNYNLFANLCLPEGRTGTEF